MLTKKISLDKFDPQFYQRNRESLHKVGHRTLRISSQSEKIKAHNYDISILLSPDYLETARISGR